MLYTLIADSRHYLGAVIDSDYVASVVGSLRGGRLDDRIDINHSPRTWQGVFPDAVPVLFPVLSREDESKLVPDIAEFQGRLFLSNTAYEILKRFLDKDGDVIPASSVDGSGYIFTPLHTAEEFEALADKLCKKNDWGDVEHLAFNEERLCALSFFRSEYTNNMRLYCAESIKQAIEDAGLTGLYITNDLANVFPEAQSHVAPLN
ncbi:MAG TPA: hypothetical protein VLF09_01220 [Cellvibrio sp.]|nr:hypothetical protein [Cellvibrio sp.]